MNINNSWLRGARSIHQPEWTIRAKPVEAIRVDVGFLIRESFYYGPENGFTQEQWQQLREPLYQPKVEKYGDYLLSTELGELTSELVLYYQDVLRLVASHQKEIGQELDYFWMRPMIFARGEFDIDFPWYDTWEDAVRLLDALAGASDGLLVDDLDQGWDFQAFADGSHIFLREGNWENNEEHIVIAANRAQLSSQIPVVRERVAHLIGDLSVALGRNYWSSIWRAKR